MKQETYIDISPITISLITSLVAFKLSQYEIVEPKITISFTVGVILIMIFRQIRLIKKTRKVTETDAEIITKKAQ